MSGGKKRDLEWALSTTPAPTTKRLTVMDDEKVVGWFDELMTRREGGAYITHAYIAQLLTKLAHEHGIVKSSEKINEYQVRHRARSWKRVG